MKTYTYSTREINKEYRRAGLGISLSLLPLLLLEPSSVIVFILGSVLCLFLLYGARTYERSRTHICITASEISSVGIRKKAIKWEELEAVKLSYFSTRRDGENGWMQLKLKGRGVRLRIESTLDDFEGLVETCAGVARQKNLMMDPSTVRNLRAIRVDAVDSGNVDLTFPENNS